MGNIKTDLTLDAKGLACPMPIVKTKKAMKDLEAGQVIEVEATDKGSKADIQAWAESSGHHYLGTVEDGEVLKHYLRKSSGDEKIEQKHPVTASNDELMQKLASDENVVLLDVREEAEYAFNHIPNAVSVPLGDLDSRLKEFDQDADIYVVCRTGTRSDLASQKLAANGFKKVTNVVPGMSEWKGESQKEL